MAVKRRQLTADDLRYMNIPEELWRVRLDGVQDSVRKGVSHYLANLDEALREGVGLLLIGNPGVGKSGIATLVAKESRARGRSAYFTTLWELRQNIRDDAMFDDSQSVLGRCKSVDVLVLDNLRAEEADEKWILPVRTIEELLSYRRSRKRLSIVTTRLNNTELPKAVRGIADVIKGAMLPMVVTGTNLREERAAALARRLLGKR